MKTKAEIIKNKLDRQAYLAFLALLDEEYEKGLNTDGYSHKELIWFGYQMAKKNSKSEKELSNEFIVSSKKMLTSLLRGK